MFTVTLVHGGWGAILMYKDYQKEIFGAKQDTTNNVMELTAVIEALKLVRYPCNIKIYSDSAYVVNAFLQGWIFNWLKKGWKTADGKPVKNKELWQMLYGFTQTHNIEFIKVKGHADNPLNNRCDELARNAILEL